MKPRPFFTRIPAAVRVAKFLWENRKAEIAVALAAADIVSRAVQAATGH